MGIIGPESNCHAGAQLKLHAITQGNTLVLVCIVVVLLLQVTQVGPLEPFLAAQQALTVPILAVDFELIGLQRLAGTGLEQNEAAVKLLTAQLSILDLFQLGQSLSQMGNLVIIQGQTVDGIQKHSNFLLLIHLRQNTA